MGKSGASSNSSTQHTKSTPTVDQTKGGDSAELKLDMVRQWNYLWKCTSDIMVWLRITQRYF